MFQWKESDELDNLFKDGKARRQVEDELADVLITALNFSTTLNIDVHHAISSKLQKIGQKYPVDKEGAKLVFIAAPFSNLLNKSGTLDQSYIKFLSDIEKFFSERGHRTYLSPQKREMGGKMYPFGKIHKNGYEKCG